MMKAAVILWLALALSLPAKADERALTGLTDPTLALGLAHLRPYASSEPFINLFRYARHWEGVMQNGKRVTGKELRAVVEFDEHGWPKRMNEDVDFIQTIWSLNRTPHRLGRYVLTYKGQGDFRFLAQSKEIGREPGRIVMRNDVGTALVLEIHATDPDGTGDYLRDLVLMREAHEDLHAAGAVFNPDWIARIADVRQIRFMDWMGTNGSKVSSWDDRTRPDDARWNAGAGAPVEVMVRLANEIGADPWFTIPHRADEDYIRRFATYVRDHLDPRLVATVEYSNELWNRRFEQSKAVRAAASAAGVEPAEEAARRAASVMRIWTDVFGDDAERRLVRALGAWTYRPNWLRQALSAKPPGSSWLSLDEIAEEFDAVAITTYFGNDRNLRKSLAKEFKRDGRIDHDALAARLRAPGGTVPKLISNLKQIDEIAEDAGLRVIAYEGGQHLHVREVYRLGRGALNEAFIDFIRSPQMADLYEEVWSAWRDFGDGPFMHFQGVARPGKSGSWGLWSDTRDSNPRADLLARLNEETSAWWEKRAGPHFQQGVIRRAAEGEALIGGPEEDYLIGGPGDDELAPGGGMDGLLGAGGYDIVRIDGERASHDVELTPFGAVVRGPTGVKRLAGVEKIIFSDGSEVTLE